MKSEPIILFTNEQIALFKLTNDFLVNPFETTKDDVTIFWATFKGPLGTHNVKYFNKAHRARCVTQGEAEMKDWIAEYCFMSEENTERLKVYAAEMTHFFKNPTGKAPIFKKV